MSKQGASIKRYGLGGLLLAAGVGLLLGLLVAWGIAPVRWVNTDPVDLRPSHQTAYVLMVADSYALSGDVAVAQERLLQLAPNSGDMASVAALIEQVASERLGVGDNVGATRLRRLLNDTSLASLATPGQPGAAAMPTSRAPLPTWVVLVFGAGIFILALAAVAGLMLARSNRRAAAEPEFPVFDGGLTPLTEPIKPPARVSAAPATPTPTRRPSLEDILGVSEPSASAAPRPIESDEALDEQPPIWDEPDDEPDDAVDEEELLPPARPVAPAAATIPAAAAGVLSEFNVAYSYGDDDFYHSVTIDTADESFVGQCGIVISDVLGSADAQQVDAFDLWLFETHGTRTVSKVLMSPWAKADDGIVARLSRKGETLTMRPGLQVVLQTMTLRLTAQITDLAYQPDQQRPDAVFERLGLHLVVERLAL